MNRFAFQNTMTTCKGAMLMCAFFCCANTMRMRESAKDEYLSPGWSASRRPG